MWSMVNDIKNTNKDNTIDKITINGKTITDPDKIAEQFNIFFEREPHKVCENIPDVDYSFPLQLTNNTSMFLYPLDRSELLQLFKNLKNKKSFGICELSNVILKEFAKLLVDPVGHVINESLINGIFPEVFKVAIVAPIHKKNDRSDMANYRPVSLLSSISKLFEYAMLSRLLPFLEKNKILSDTQYGFRKQKSTVSAILSFYDKIIEYFERKQYPIGVFCDLSRAFDCVNHNLLIAKLEKYGIRGIPLKWCASYLNNRKQCVEITSCINGTNKKYRSTILESNIGVPQGSILGPVLFIIYTNDLPYHIRDADVTMYADDNNFLINGKGEIDTYQKANAALNDAFTWYSGNSLLFNLSKTNFVNFHPYQKHIDQVHNIQVNNEIIDKNNIVKFLGVHIEEDLSWHEHCSKLVSTLGTKFYLFQNLKDYLEQSYLINIYYSEIESRIRYGILLWGTSPHAETVLRAQKRIIRCITSAEYRAPCRPIFKKLGILTVINLYVLEVASFIHESNYLNYTNQTLHSYNMRKTQLILPKHSLKKTSQAPTVMGIKIYNRIPPELKILSPMHFKTKLKHYLKMNPFYKISEYFDSNT